MTKATIFTTTKANEGLAAIHQENALGSWTRLHGRPEVLVIGDERGTADLCARTGARHIPGLPTNEFGTPLVSELFRIGQAHALGDIVCYANADVVLFDDALRVIDLVDTDPHPFLIVARRRDLDVPRLIDFGDSQWADGLRTKAMERGRLGHSLAIDWFAFRPGAFLDMPPFAIARTTFDNWLLWKAVSSEMRLIDATPAMCLLHQRHEYESVPGGRIGIWSGVEAQRARQYLGHWSRQYSITHATHTISTDGTVVPARGLAYRLARPRRAVAHALRWTRPVRLRMLAEVDRRSARARRQS